MSQSCDATAYCDAGDLGPSLAEVCSTSTFITFMTLLNGLLRKNNKISGVCDRIKSVEEPHEYYDFIVVGGGAAGSVVAARLSEVANWNVLLLEAGPDEPIGAQVPAFVGTYLSTEIGWKYKTTNESYACQSTNGSCSWPSGRTLGGNTAHNHMVYLRGNPTDYNNWAAQGNEGWKWEEVEPFFMYSENNAEIGRVGRSHHSTGGKLPVSRFPDFPEFGNSIMDAAQEAGFSISDDLNGDQVTGFSHVQTASENGVRRSTATAFLRPIRNRENLHISLESYVTKVLTENKRAIGVEYYKDGERKVVYASKEVIVSGGAMRSPFILLHSGIGPKDHLNSVGIDVVQDLPGVGENIQNHVSYRLSFTINETDAYDDTWAAALEYLTCQTGPLSSTGMPQLVGMLATNATASDYPDIEIFFTGYTASCGPGDVDALRSDGQRVVTFMPTYIHPQSKGRVSLASSDPFDAPVIWGNHFSDSNDVDRMVDGIEMSLALTKTKALEARNITLTTTQLDACSDYEFMSRDYWKCAIHWDGFPDNHQAGSCKMGPASDSMAVVDNQLRVHGIEGLRVADAAIMPAVTSSNTATPTIMIGERAADFIKNTYSFSRRRFGWY